MGKVGLEVGRTRASRASKVTGFVLWVLVSHRRVRVVFKNDFLLK